MPCSNPNPYQTSDPRGYQCVECGGYHQDDEAGGLGSGVDAERCLSCRGTGFDYTGPQGQPHFYENGTNCPVCCA